jgi:streptogramin lyase
MGDMPPGSVFAGHRIEAVAGRGGMGVVYRARQLSLDRIVALKVIAPALMQDEAIRRRFLRESRVAASIDHPHVIPIYYAGEEAGVAYIAMRHVAGDDLRTLVRRTGPLEPGRAARIAEQVGAALDAAHASGLVHRDVKPANVLLGPGEHVYLTDFGLTKHVLSEAGATKPGHWVGTLDFIAPEQIRGERVDARADVYALGCVLHYMLAGKPPFSPEGEEAKMWAHLMKKPPAVSAAAPGVPEEFDDVIARALAKDPVERFQSAGDLGRAAVAAASGGRAAGRDTVVARGAAAPIEIDTRTAGTAIAPPIASAPAPEPPRRGSRILAIAGVVAVLLATVAVGALAMRDEPDGGAKAPEQPAPTPAAKKGLKVTSTKIGGRPNNITGAEGHIWTGEFLSDRLVTLDPATGKPQPGPRPEIGVGLTGLAVDGDTIWAIAARDRRLVHLDARTGKVLGQPVALPSAANAVAAGKDAVYVALSQAGIAPGDQIMEVDKRTGETRRTIDVRDGVRRLEIARGRLWILSSDPAVLVGIDLDSGNRRRVELDASTSVDLAQGAGYLWVTTSGDQLMRIDLRGGKPDTFATGRGPAGVVVRKGTVWVANRTASTLTRIDVRTGRQVGGEKRVPINPYDLAAYDDAIWVTTLAGGKIARITDLDG